MSRYGFAFAAVFVATVVAVWLRPFSRGTPFLFFFPAVVFAALRGGQGPGLLATLFSSLAANYFLLGNSDAFHVDGANLLRTGFFAAAFTTLSVLAHKSRREHSNALLLQARLLDAAAEPILIRDSEDRILFWNSGAEQLYGWTANEAAGRLYRELLDPKTATPIDYSTFERTGHRRGEITHTTKSGAPVIVISHWTYEQERVDRAWILQTDFDVTELRKTQQSLREGARQLAESADILHIAEEAAGLGVWSWNLGDNPIEVTDQCRTLFGFARDEVVSYSVFQYALHPEDRARVDAAIREAIRTKSAYDTEYRVIWPDGNVHWLIAKGHVAVDEGGKATRMSGIAVDITEWKQAQESLRESEEVLGALVNSVDDAIIVHSVEGSIITVNERFLGMYGVAPEDAPALKISDISAASAPTSTLPALWLRVLAGEQQTFEWRALRPRDGTEFDVEVFLTRVRLKDNRDAVLAKVHDLTDRKKAEEEKRALQVELAQAQKLEAIGQLAGGIAHDFNNILNVIFGHSELALAHPSAAVKHVEQIQNAANTAAVLTRQLLAFSRKTVFEPRVVDVNEVIRQTTALLPRMLGEHIAVELELSTESYGAKFVPGQLEQILINLAVNARDAMPGGGTLRVGTDVAKLDAECAREVGAPSAGEYVVCIVRDTGHGIPNEMLPRIFEPFFTTKAIGKGTGLGLATVRGIVNQNSGFVVVESNVGVGTTFKIFVPRAQLAEMPEQPVPKYVKSQGGSETILLVEDSAALREMTRTFLEMQGYTVHEASNGIEALGVLSDGNRVDLLFTDVVLPALSGPELARKVKSIRPGIKILFATGYAGEHLEEFGGDSNTARVLEKPYTFDTLSEAIRQALK